MLFQIDMHSARVLPSGLTVFTDRIVEVAPITPDTKYSYGTWAIDCMAKEAVDLRDMSRTKLDLTPKLPRERSIPVTGFYFFCPNAQK